MKKLVSKMALDPEPVQGRQGRYPDKQEIELRKYKKNAENKQILTACVTLNNLATLELLLPAVMQKLTTGDDEFFFEHLLENAAMGAPKILAAVLRRMNPQYAFYSKFVRRYVQLIVQHMDASDAQEEFRAFIWKSQWPLHAALLSSKGCQVLAQQQKLFEANFLEHERNFEEMAVRMLDACKDQMEVSMVLTERSTAAWEESTPMHYAMRHARQQIIAHRFFQKVYTKLWYVQSAEAAAFEAARYHGSVGPIEDLFTRPMRPKQLALRAAHALGRLCRSCFCGPAHGGSAAVRTVSESGQGGLRRRAAVRPDPPPSVFNADDDADDAGTYEAATSGGAHARARFGVNGSWAERALIFLWTAAVCLVMFAVLVLMTPFRALAPVCPPLARLTRGWLDNNEFDCAFFKVVVYNSLHMVYVVYFVMYTLSDIFSWRGVGSFTEPDVMERVLLVWSVGFFLGNGTIVELLLP